jgi:hypothetical protein
MKCLTLDTRDISGSFNYRRVNTQGIRILIYLPVLGKKPVVLANLLKHKETRHLVNYRVHPGLLLPRDILRFWEIRTGGSFLN